MRAESDVDIAVQQKQARALVRPFGIKVQTAARAAVARARHRSLNRGRTAELLIARRNIESMEAEHWISVLKGVGDDVECSRERIDDGRARDAVLGSNICAPRIRRWLSGCSKCRAVRFVQQTGMPQRQSPGVCVESVNAVVLCGDENHAVRFALESETGHI